MKRRQEQNQWKSTIKIFSTFWPLYLLWSDREGEGHVWAKARPPMDGSRVHFWALCEHLWVRHFAQGALKVFWHLHLLPKHLPCFVHTGAGPKNPRFPELVKICLLFHFVRNNVECGMGILVRVLNVRAWQWRVKGDLLLLCPSFPPGCYIYTHMQTFCVLWRYLSSLWLPDSTVIHRKQAVPLLPRLSTKMPLWKLCRVLKKHSQASKQQTDSTQ